MAHPLFSGVRCQQGVDFGEALTHAALVNGEPVFALIPNKGFGAP